MEHKQEVAFKLSFVKFTFVTFMNNMGAQLSNFALGPAIPKRVKKKANYIHTIMFISCTTF